MREQHKTKMHRSGSLHSAGGSLKHVLPRDQTNI